jgi:Trypsin
MIGAYNLDDGQGGDRNVIQNIVHPSYPLNRSYTVNYDVSIAILDRPVTDVSPIKINFDDNIPSDTGEPLTMLGFGSTIGGKETVPGGPNQQARILQVAPTEYVSFDDCAVAKDPDTGILWGNSNTQTIVQPHWFCTLLNDPLTTSTCYGDSGGRKCCW